MLNQHSHIAHPSRIDLNLNGDRVQISAAQARLLTLFDNQGILNGERDSLHIRSLIKRGWVVRTRGSYRLTPVGRDAHTVLTDYYARKKTATALERDQP